MLPEKEQKSLEYWSGRAKEYSRLHMDSYRSDKRMMFAEEVAKSIPDKDDIEALDLGCGTGFMSMILLDAGCSVTGIDFSQDMLALARENLARKGYEATFLHMRAQQLDFPDGSFDFIVSRNVTWTLEDVDEVYAEVWRVLKDGGVFLNLDANYGKCFNEADARGEVPTHPTQTLSQLRTRNDIAHNLAITLVERPQWDIDQFWRLGASEIRCRSIGGGTNASGSQMFALEVHKPGTAPKEQAVVEALDTPSQAVLGGVGAASKDHAGEVTRAKVMLVDYVRTGDFEFDPRKFVIRKNGIPVKLTPKEFNILLTLARNPGKLVSRAELKAAAWGNEFAEDDRSIAVYVRRIREKLEDDSSHPRYLLTHWGKGYSFDPTGGKV